jgi:uncharacterized protein
MDIQWAVVLSALVVGVLVGLTGVGAGAVMTPVLVGFFGVSLPVAIATDLLFATFTKIVGSVSHHQRGSIQWSVAKKMWWGSIPGTLLGVTILLVLVGGARIDWLVWPLALIVLLTAITLARRALAPDGNGGGHGKPHPAPPARWIPVAGGFGIGTAVSLTSVGAGALGMALLVRLAPAGTPPRELVGTDLVHGIPIALIAGGAYGLTGLVSWPLLGMMLMGSVPGVLIGSLLSGRAPARFLNATLAVMLSAAVALLVVK